MAKESDDGELFRTLVGDVVPLRTNRVVHDSRRRPAIPTQTINDEFNIVENLLSDQSPLDDLETGDELIYSQPNLAKNTLRKLRRGDFKLEAELDLHGQTAVQARQELSLFLQWCIDQGYRCVRVIHGKGLRSPNQRPVIKASIGRWLRLHDVVLAFHSALPHDGGTGAVYVLLKKK